MTTAPWERLPGETDKAFRAFQHYRDAGPDRSLVASYRELYKPDAQKPRPFFRRWSRRHRWAERATAWDEHVDREVQAELLDEHRAMAVRHVAIARLIQDKALEALEAKDPDDFTIRDIRDWLETGQKLERLAVGLETERSRIEGVGQGPAQVLELVVAELRDRPDLAREIEEASDEDLPRLLEAHLGISGDLIES